MDLKQIQARVEEIRQVMEKDNDDEYAHSCEDALHQDVLQHIADKAPEPWASLAREALKTDQIKFERWCA